MTESSASPGAAIERKRARHAALRLAPFAALLFVELVGLALAYQLLTDFECRATDAEGTCRFLRSLVARAVSVLAALTVFVWARPRTLEWLEQTAPRARSWAAAAFHFGGVALILLPLLAIGGTDLSENFARVLAPWTAGALAASLGVLAWLAAPRDWWIWLRRERFAPLLVVAGAALIPDLANVALPLWDLSLLTRATFDAVQLVLEELGAPVVSDPASYIIGVDDFLVQVARQCSGVEGFALIASFTALYAFLFRHEIRLRRFWLVVLPLGLALSWVINVLRIAALIGIGAHISPELAVNGFHSYAGWMFFTLLALGLLCAVQVTPWLHIRGEQQRFAAPPSLREDLNAALIVPFIAFMLASLVASALAPQPELAYPLKAAAMAAALAPFHRVYRKLDWSFDPVAVGAGAAVGIGWIALQPPSGSEDAILATSLTNLGTIGLAAWVVTRLFGAILLVPVVEELFFRGYVLKRLDRDGPLVRTVAIAASSGLFALLHAQWLEAFCAGLVFAILAVRRGRLVDAIVAHIIANLIVASWAVVFGRWGAL